jgi:hypothetical protein
VKGAVGEVASAPGLSYRAGLHLKWRSAEEEDAPLARFVFTLADGSTEASDWLTTVEEVIEKKSDDFVRYETDPGSARAPDHTVDVSLELQIPAGAVALDNILLWETTPPCFDACAD